MSASVPDPELTAGLNVRTDPGAARADDIRQLTGNLTIGVRLLCSATAFLFISFLFAFFYLRAVNSNGLWRPKGVDPVQSWGIAVMVLMVLSAVVFDVARRALVAGTESTWRSAGATALALSLLVILAQVLEYTTISFKTWQGGWAAVFWGWTTVQALFWLGAIYWIETLVAQSFRRPPASPREGTAGTDLLRPSADSAIVYLYSMAFMGIIAYILVYLVK